VEWGSTLYNILKQNHASNSNDNEDQQNRRRGHERLVGLLLLLLVVVVTLRAAAVLQPMKGRWHPVKGGVKSTETLQFRQWLGLTEGHGSGSSAACHAAKKKKQEAKVPRCRSWRSSKARRGML